MLSCCTPYYYYILFILSFLGPLPLVSSVTPLQADQFALELQHHPDHQLVNYVLDGISNGFRVGFSPSHKLKSATNNKPSAQQHAAVVDEYLAHEVSLGRVAGPFTSPPLPNLHISSFGVIPKRGQPGAIGKRALDCGSFFPWGGWCQ